MPEDITVRQALRDLNRAEQQILTIRQALQELPPGDPLPLGGIVIVMPPIPNPTYYGDCGKLLNWAREWLSGHPEYL